MIGRVTPVVRNDVLAFYGDRLGFALLEDTPIEPGRRWVVVRQPGRRPACCSRAR